MIALAGARNRSVLLGVCTAVVSGLLLVAVAVATLGLQGEAVFEVIADPGTRGGYIFGTLLLCLPPLLLHYQVARLGTAARERRYAAFRVAGATPWDVRRLGAFEVGLPSLVGAIAGIGVYAGLRVTLGADLHVRTSDEDVSLRLVPVEPPPWWAFVGVVLAVGLVGALVGLLVSRSVTVAPLAVGRRTVPARPRPWGALLLAFSVLVGMAAVLGAGDHGHSTATLLAIAAIGCAVLGLVALGPYVAYRIGRATAVRATSPELLLAARRLATDPYTTARAAGAVGGIGLVAGGLSTFVLVGTTYQADMAVVIAAGVVGVCLLAGLVVVVGSLCVHAVELLLDRRRSVAALSAFGLPTDVLLRAQRHEACLVVLPMTATGTLLGALSVGVVSGAELDGFAVWWVLATSTALVVTCLLAWAAVLVAVRLTRPLALRAADPENLRTE